MMVRARIIVDYVPVPEVGIIWVSWDGTGRRGHRARVGAVRSRGCEPRLQAAPRGVNHGAGRTWRFGDAAPNGQRIIGPLGTTSARQRI